MKDEILPVSGGSSKSRIESSFLGMEDSLNGAASVDMAVGVAEDNNEVMVVGLEGRFAGRMDEILMG